MKKIKGKNHAEESEYFKSIEKEISGTGGPGYNQKAGWKSERHGRGLDNHCLG
jgi:hypothetical protein